MPVTVITRVTFEPEARAGVLEFNLRSLPIMKRQAGLVSIQQMLAIDSHELVSVLEWEDLESHLQCLSSPDFEAINDEWNALLKSGGVHFELGVYQAL